MKKNNFSNKKLNEVKRKSHLAKRINVYDKWISIWNKQISIVSWIRLIAFIIIFISIYYIKLNDHSNVYYICTIAFVAIFIFSISRFWFLNIKTIDYKLKNILLKRNLSKLDDSWHNKLDLFDYNYNYSHDDELQGKIDLDLYGDYSLFHLIDNTTTQTGEDKLKNNINTALTNENKINNNKFKNYQGAVREISLNRRFSLDFQTNCLNPSFRRNPNKLIKLNLHSLINDLNNKNNLNSIYKNKLLSIVAKISVTLTGITFISQYFFGYFVFFQLFFAMQIFILLLTFFKKKTTNTSIYNISDIVPVIINQIKLLNKYKFRNNFLIKNKNKIVQDKNQIYSLQKINKGLAIRQYPLPWFIFNLLFLWDIHYEYAFYSWLKNNEKAFYNWTEALSELDVINSHAIYYFEHPGYCFAVQANKNNYLSAINAKHPMINYSSSTGNNFTFEQKGSVYLISGSNMSGKSTFLRTVGLNYILGRIGSVLPAEYFALVPGRILCSIQVTDSLKEGISRFYKEVLKIKYIYENVSKSKNNIILIDEIFHGTNTKERLIAAEKILKELSKNDMIAIIATHDISLTKLKTGKKFENLHFSEQISNNKMTFNYKLNKGALKTTNALKILAIEGLPV